MGTQSDNDMTPEDLWIIKRMSDIGSKLTGYPAISIFHDFKYHPKEVITGSQDWVYEHLGALFWTVEIWAPNKDCLLYTSPSPRDGLLSRMPSSA